MATPQGLMDIPMKPPMPEDESSRLPPVGLPPEPEAPMGDKSIQAPPSQLSGGTWERLSPGQFMYHPSDEDLQLADLPGHFAEIEVVGDLLLMPNGDVYEGGIEHDIDADGTPDAPTHFGKEKEKEPEPDGDEEINTSKLGVPPGNSWMDKPGPSILPLDTKKHY